VTYCEDLVFKSGRIAIFLNGERCSLVTRGCNRSCDSNVAQRNNTFYFPVDSLLRSIWVEEAAMFVACRPHRFAACGVFSCTVAAAITAFVDLGETADSSDDVRPCECRLTPCQYSHVDRSAVASLHRYVLGIPTPSSVILFSKIGIY
jgi:hypothetical protein